MKKRPYPQLAAIRRIPPEEKKPGIEPPYMMTDDDILELGGNIEDLNRIRKIMNILYPHRHKKLMKKYRKS